MTDCPPLESLTRRLAETPEDFLIDPRNGQIDPAAIVSDLLRDLGGEPLDSAQAERFAEGSRAKNGLTLVLITAWLLHDEAFRAAGSFAPAAYDLLDEGLRRLAGVVEPQQFVSDPDRREELVRIVLKALDLTPPGETTQQAADRLTTLDSIERIRIVKDTRAAQKRTEAIREAMRKKEAEEAAASYGRE